MIIGHTLMGKGNNHVMVLHGWFGDYNAFAPTFDSLDTDTFNYAFVDYRGYGKSRDMAGQHTMEEIAGDVIGLAEELGWHEFHLVGHSMGGMATLRILLDINDPDRIRSIVAVAPVPPSGVPLDKANTELFNGAIKHDEDRYKILDFTTGNRNTGTWLDHMVRCSRETTTEAAYADYLTAWTKTDFADAIKGKTTPVCVCIGEHDPAFTEAAMKQTYLAWLPNAELKCITNAGHYPMLETPVQLATIMEDFMKQHCAEESIRKTEQHAHA
jgi:pimeloyl-ACP methyl ester carboxylesterase